MILITLTSCHKSPKCNSTHTISGQVLNGSTLQPMANIQMYLFCGFRGTSSEKIWEPITDKDGKYSITYNCNELSADSIRVGIIEPEKYCGYNRSALYGGELYHKANFNGVYNFYLATQGKICIIIKEKTKGSLNKNLPQIVRMLPDNQNDFLIKLDSTSLNKHYTYNFKCRTPIKIYRGVDSIVVRNPDETINKPLIAQTLNDPIVDTVILTY